MTPVGPVSGVSGRSAGRRTFEDVADIESPRRSVARTGPPVATVTPTTPTTPAGPQMPDPLTGEEMIDDARFVVAWIVSVEQDGLTKPADNAPAAVPAAGQE
jgi:hypothetical protein